MLLSEIRIDPEFRDQIPPLTTEEFQQLTENILQAGRVYQPLIVWKGILLDGHNRRQILIRHPNVTYEIEELEFESRYDAIVWICKNQLGRRNLTLEQKKYLVGKRYEAEKKIQGHPLEGGRGADGRYVVQSGNGCHFGEKTAERLARELNQSPRGIRIAHEFSKGVDAAEEVIPGIRQEILSGTIVPKHKDVARVAKAPPEQRETLAENLRITREEKSQKRKEAQGTTPSKKEVVEQIKNISAKMGEHKEAYVERLEDMSYEMDSAMETMIWRWNHCKETYPHCIQTAEAKENIRERITKLRTYLQQVEEGELWNT